MSKNEIDIDVILAEYGDVDFGFSAISEDDYNKAINEVTDSVEDYKARLKSVEKIILPFLTKLLKTADQPVIKWPDRGTILKEQIEKILKLTRG